MNRIFFILLFLPCIAGAQIITTFAGSGTSSGFSGDGGPATAATMTKTFGLALDASGNFYVSDNLNNRIRKIDPAGIITTCAGTGVGGFSGDGGPATAASLNWPTELALYGNNLYIAEHNNSRVRKLDLTTNIITTYAGNGLNGYSGDGGPATAAKISRPYGIGVDNAGNVYIGDQDTHRIRKISAATGIITTFAGTGVAGYSGDGGPATSAQVHLCDDIKCDATGNIYFCDFLNDAVRKIDTSGIITTIAGTGIAGFSGDGGPATSAKLRGPDAVLPDSHGNIYISDMDNHRVRMINPAGVITTVAGTGVMGFGGDGGLAILAQFSKTNDMVLDTLGNLYICDYDNYRVRKISGLALAVPSISQSQVILQPNPASEFLTINCPAIINSVIIANVDGKIVHNIKDNSHEVRINVADLPAGIYFVNINGMETKEFVKK